MTVLFQLLDGISVLNHSEIRSIREVSISSGFIIIIFLKG